MEVYAAGRRGVGDRCLVVSIDISLDKEKYSEIMSCIPTSAPRNEKRPMS